jgi:hypothetical protein
MQAMYDIAHNQPFYNQHSAKNELQGESHCPHKLESLMEKTWETCIKPQYLNFLFYPRRVNHYKKGNNDQYQVFKFCVAVDGSVLRNTSL